MQLIDLYLFQTTVGLPNYIWHHTSSTSSYVYEQETYLPLPIGRGNILSTDEIQKNKLDVTIPVSSALAQFCIAQTIPRGISLTLYRSINGTVSPWFRGLLSTIECSGGAVKLNFTNNFSKLKIQGLRRSCSRACPHALYDTACGVAKDSFDVSATVVSYSGDTLVVSFAEAKDNGFFTGGMVKFGNLLSTVLLHDGTSLYLSKTIAGLDPGETVTVYAGCDKKIATCRTKFSNEYRFGGMPALTIDNPFSSSGAL